MEVGAPVTGEEDCTGCDEESTTVVGAGTDEVLSTEGSAELLSTGGSIELLSTGGSIELLSTGGSIELLSTTGSIELLSTGGSREVLSTGGTSEVVSPTITTVSLGDSDTTSELVVEEGSITDVLTGISELDATSIEDVDVGITSKLLLLRAAKASGSSPRGFPRAGSANGHSSQILIVSTASGSYTHLVDDWYGHLGGRGTEEQLQGTKLSMLLKGVGLRTQSSIFC